MNDVSHIVILIIILFIITFIIRAAFSDSDKYGICLALETAKWSIKFIGVGMGLIITVLLWINIYLYLYDNIKLH